MRVICLGLLLLLAGAAEAQAETSLWKVQKGDNIFYIGGTCHLLRAEDLPLPTAYESAYAEADRVIFETDIGKMNDPDTQKKLMMSMIYNDGSTLEQHLKPETYAKLESFSRIHDLQLDGMKGLLKPAMVAMIIMIKELAAIGVDEKGVDQIIYNWAHRDGKNTGELESIDEQIQYAASMGEGIEDKFINYAMEDAASIRQEFHKIIDAWRAGDSQALNTFMVAGVERLPSLYKSLLKDRNEKWMPLIEAYSKSPEVELIMVGVAHLVGSDGVIHKLKQRGYQIEQL